MKVGDKIEVIDQRAIGLFPIWGKIMELDEHPLGASYAKIRVDSPCKPAPEVWVNLRMAKVVKEA